MRVSPPRSSYAYCGCRDLTGSPQRRQVAATKPDRLACYARCDREPSCRQAVHEIIFANVGRCWLGLNAMSELPENTVATGLNYQCYSKAPWLSSAVSPPPSPPPTAPPSVYMMAGWCPNWREGSLVSGARTTGYLQSFFRLNRTACFARCDAEDGCQQAVSETDNLGGLDRCWIGSP